MRIVLDTSVMVAAVRAPRGASARLLRGALQREYELLISTPLLLEYEAVMTRPEHLAAAGLTAEEVSIILDALTQVGIPVEFHFSWRPFLRDSGDEMVLETAVNGATDSLVTFNMRDFTGITEHFGITLNTPAQACRRLGQHEAK